MLKLFSLFVAMFFATVLSANSAQTMDFNFIKKGVEDNNTLLVIGGIQGDEPGGFVAASLLATHYEITKGSLWVVPNLNFQSIIDRNRGPYGDMNRKFANLSEQDPEYKIVDRIKNYIKDQKVKLVVNLHDGSGFYRHKHIDENHTHKKWGQCSVIDQTDINVSKYGNLKEISTQVVEHVNKSLLDKEHVYNVHNTKTKEGDIEMEKSLTYYAINNGKAAFGNEASKNLPTHKRAYYHLLALEKYMTIMGIKFKRNFKLDTRGVYNAINNDIYISLYNGKIKLPLSKVRKNLKYFPIRKDGKIEFEGSNPLFAVVKKGDTYVVQYGNRRLLNLKADYLEYDDANNSVTLEVDGKVKDYSFGSIIDVKKDFIVKNSTNYRVNVIGYKNKKNRETEVKIEKSTILKDFSIDESGQIYRVEYYNKNKFAGMVLVKFAS